MPPIKVPNSPLLTTTEAATYLRVHQWTVYNWLRSGTLRGKKIGGVWRVHIQEVKEKGGAR